SLRMSIPLPKAPSSLLPSTRVDALWDADAPKYRVFCRRVHVVRAATIIGYAQLALLALFSALLLYVFAHAAIEGIPAEDGWMKKQGAENYVTSIVSAVGLQLCLVLMLLHGIKTERRSYLLPFIIFATLAAVMAGVSMLHSGRHHVPINAFLSNLIGVVIHVWCIHVMWRCYCYLGDKKVAEHIGEQLQATSLAFSFDYTQPPAYTELVPQNNQMVAEKQPLSMA
ncbi:hypothetical protein PFISCL1PPCAC_19331, partial [Pristionchus fissidentatus]